MNFCRRHFASGHLWATFQIWIRIRMRRLICFQFLLFDDNSPKCTANVRVIQNCILYVAWLLEFVVGLRHTHSLTHLLTSTCLQIVMFCIFRFNNKLQPILGLAALCKAFRRTYFPSTYFPLAVYASCLRFNKYPSSIYLFIYLFITKLLVIFSYVSAQ